MSAPWSEEKNEKMRALVALKVSNADIARIFGCQPQNITRHQRRLNLAPPMTRRYGGVSVRNYREMIAEVANKEGLPLEAVERPRRKSKAGKLRWHVWRQLRDRGASLKAIAKAAGVDHSSVHFAVHGRHA